MGRREDEYPASPKPRAVAVSRIVTVAVTALANGGDNLGIYIPLFAVHNAWSIALIGGVFVFMTALWSALAHWLVYHPTIGMPFRFCASRGADCPYRPRRRHYSAARTPPITYTSKKPGSVGIRHRPLHSRRYQSTPFCHPFSPSSPHASPRSKLHPVTAVLAARQGASFAAQTAQQRVRP
jgi:hypothetical protein